MHPFSLWSPLRAIAALALVTLLVAGAFLCPVLTLEVTFGLAVIALVPRVAVVRNALLASFWATFAVSLVLSNGPLAEAQTNNVPRAPNIRLFGSMEATSGQSIASTTGVAVAISTITNSTVYDPSTHPFQNASQYISESLHDIWGVDVTKAAAGQVTCAVYLNGALITRSQRTMQFAAGDERSFGGFSDLKYATTSGTLQDPFNVGAYGETQLVQVGCFTPDGSAVVVNRVQNYVEELY